MAARLVENGASEIITSRVENTGVHISERTSLSLQDLVPLNAGDTVELQARLTGADGYLAADRTSFWGFKVG